MPEDDDLDLNRRQQKAADRLALAQMLEGTGSSVRTGGATRRLERAGIDLDAATEAGNYQNTLFRMAEKGGVHAKRSKMLQQNLQYAEIDKQEGLAKSRGEEDIARAYQNLSEGFTAALPSDVDTSSPAVLDAVRRYMEGRSTDTSRYLGDIEAQSSERRLGVMQGLATTLDETGALVDALKMLKDEQGALRKAQYMNLGMGALGLGVQSLGFGGAFGQGGAFGGDV